MSGRIGPNAIIRMEEALRATVGAAKTEEVFVAAGLDAYLKAPPGEMVDEREVTALHEAALARLGPDQAAEAGHYAGELTAIYLLEYRIPQPFQLALKALPAEWRAKLLLSAIGRHAWTFVGSGRLSFTPSHPVAVTIAGGPVRGADTDIVLGAFYSGCFQQLFRRLVNRRTRAEARSEATRTEPTLSFDLRWK
ncbi:bacteriochlorophyll 4-vinyl reductase [Afifella pfennigii]|uniref:bacteriochlorophyll 4-vinyl reductase n=1 Tax=Afifella pfennigii TaxID=209897 RepID=UPI00068AB3E0|nr:bacteriochlorophyll 4-vinyl reductase [Afifella pfennigii]